uniref:Transmembrane protein n=1 Tax=Mimivirus LCMiAC01 TaxID=2506608 RepID=A0A481Z1Q1_9VIRU|nr:MAG: hypothetical protein LCMiAC01_03820 [Mimivirus LCMiAC01]
MELEPWLVILIGIISGIIGFVIACALCACVIIILGCAGLIGIGNLVGDINIGGS